MPFIFLNHDEFADWMLVDEYKGIVSSIVQRLGVKARAAGIHLIFATQRPDKDALHAVKR
ncbi:FtsK/SpoIIIE domain-containing protein [Lysinibacillus pakistanensis]|uniref:FtsK/SpoIIIE domain-containing protein n=1 Tax=Lysinibacillus pakistanensis TaxID=759811 RepID=UPI003D2E1656